MLRAADSDLTVVEFETTRDRDPLRDQDSIRHRSGYSRPVAKIRSELNGIIASYDISGDPAQVDTEWHHARRRAPS
jgi:hypothetical protein